MQTSGELYGVSAFFAAYNTRLCGAGVLQELKGNIRVFARVRPPSNSEMTGENTEQAAGNSVLATEFPSSGEHSGLLQTSVQNPGCGYFPYTRYLQPS